MRLNKRDLIIAASIIFCAMAFSPKFAFAGASISISGGTWALGTKAASSETTSSANAWTVTNDSGGAEEVLINVGSTGTWTASTDGSSSANKFVLRKDSSSGQIIKATDGVLVSGLANNGTHSFGLYFKAPPAGSQEGAHTLTVTVTATGWFLPCGSTFSVTHTAGTVAPVTKTVTYGTVATNLTGASKCWITQNLGADNQATSATDATEASAGWCWQFNRIQGFKHDGTTRTPTSWDATTDSTYTGWDPAKDPCTLLLGTGWRLPTSTEWTNADANGSWASRANTFASVLKIHAAGYINTAGTALSLRGTTGQYQSSTQYDSTQGYWLILNNTSSYLANASKAYANSVRCLKDFACGESFIVTHTAGTTAPVTKTVTYGTVYTRISGESKCWITQNLGATNQASSATDATEASAGWYWQFNRTQGFKHDGTTRTPATTWDATNDNTYTGWDPAKDPCTLLLGTGWRLPTNTEWTNVDANGAWANYNDTFASVLKLHASGGLDSSGARIWIGVNGLCWSSTQNDATTAFALLISSSSSGGGSSSWKYLGLPVRCLRDFVCGENIIITHDAGTVAPVTKTVTYGTVSTSLTGSTKCWIIQNLGAANQASSADDATEAAAGWYWQFNRTQGFKHDGTTRTPATTWNATNDNTYTGWDPAKDPCTLLLGTGWRLPTTTEWTNADTNGSWTNQTAAYNSVLKLHMAGVILEISDGSLDLRGGCGQIWSSTQASASSGDHLYSDYFGSDVQVYNTNKYIGNSVRCLKD